MTRELGSVSFAIAFLASGCMAGMAAQHAAAPAAAAAQPEAMPAGMQHMMQNCPAAVPGTRVAAADVEGGEAVTFTTTPDRVADLRARVRATADMHNRHYAAGAAEAHEGMAHGEMMGGGMAGGGAMAASHHEMVPPPSRASVEDVDGGARFVVTAIDPAEVDRLRSVLRMHAQHMQETGTCGMGPPAPR